MENIKHPHFPRLVKMTKCKTQFYSIKKYLLSIYNVPGTVLGASGTSLRQTDISAFMELTFYVGKEQAVNNTHSK